MLVPLACSVGMEAVLSELIEGTVDENSGYAGICLQHLSHPQSLRLVKEHLGYCCPQRSFTGRFKVRMNLRIPCGVMDSVWYH